MNKEYAIKLIKDLFENSFSKDKYSFFLKNLLNHFEEDNFTYSEKYIPKIYLKNVTSIERIGRYLDNNKKKVDLLIVNLIKDYSLENARSLQRNIIAWYLNGGIGGDLKDAALVAFINPTNPDWRFSFVKMEYKFEKKENGSVRIMEQYTPSKRYSFLVGPSEASHTAQSRLLPIILNDQIDPVLEEIEEIFSVEKVTKDFFEQYKKLFLNLVDEFSENIEFQEKVVKENRLEVSDFVKKLMGQIVFLYFLQKKGWLGVKQGESWGTGDKKFMHNLFNKQYCDYENYFNDILEPLFYDTLNKKDRGNNTVTGDQSYSKYFNCRIPYLNGGLFTPAYDWENTKIFINNKFFNDIYNVFDTFNFTVYESDPIETEVAVDPEMLGKVFENLLEIKDRKSKGAFYTPREIVHYMCKESLINYLISNSNFPEDRIRKLMISKDQEIALSEERLELIEANIELKEIANNINMLLKNVKICDPAVGSGAFPMGLLKEISSTRFFLNKHFLKEKNKLNNFLTEYDIKKETLENCIYGVDIDSGAVEIARLRFWLSLVVEHSIEDIEPLPNLDYKIMQGNSLIELYSPLLIAKSTDDKRNELLQELTISRMEYFNLSDTLEKRNKRDEINLLIRNIVNYDKVKQKETKWKNIQLMRSQMGLFNDKQNEQQLSFSDLNSKEINKELAEYTELERISNTEHFEWHLNFNDVFENGGFDILIANPPYIKEYVNKDAFNGLRNSPYYQGKMDLWYFFICRGSELIKENTGIITFIAQNNWTTSFGASKMRNKIIKDTQIINLIDFNNYKVFEAGIQTMVMMFKKYTELDIYVFDYRRLMGEESELKDLIKVLSKNESKNIEYLTPLINRDQLVNKKLTFSNSKIELILDKLIAKNNFNLDSNEEVAQGIVYPQDRINKASLEILGKNYKLGDGIFVLSAYEKKNLNFTEKELQLIKPVYTTKELFKWYGKKDNSDWAIYTDSRFKNLKSIYEFPNIKKHLDQFNKVITSDNKPYGLHRARDEKFFVGEKIIAVRKCSMPTFTYVDFDSYVSATFYIIKTKRINQKYLVAILNSKIIAFWLKHKGKMQGGNYQIDKEPIIELPIFIASNEDQRILIKLVDEIIKIYKDVNKSDEALKTIQLHENEINRVVYKLYDLKDEDKQEIEDDLKR